MRRWLAAGVVAGVTLAGCKAKPPVSDEQLRSTIQTQISGDTALAGQQVTASVQNGVATLNGVTANNAQKTIAARDAAGVAGVKEVQNQIAIGPVSAGATTAPPPSEPLKPSAATASVEPKRERERLHEAAPVERMPPPQQQSGDNQAPPPPQPQAAVAPPAPAPPPPPVFKSVTVPAGDDLPVRMTQTLDSGTTQQGATFSGVVASDIIVDGLVAIPAGAPVSGEVTEVHDAAHFKGSSSLVVQLNSVSRHGEKLNLATDPYSVKGKGRGANTAEKAGGGAAVGAILGGIFGGGRGAAIGAVAGGGAGAGSNAITRGQQVQIQSESVVRFHLTNPVTVRVRTDADGRHHEHNDDSDQDLQHRPGI